MEHIQSLRTSERPDDSKATPPMTTSRVPVLVGGTGLDEGGLGALEGA